MGILIFLLTIINTQKEIKEPKHKVVFQEKQTVQSPWVDKKNEKSDIRYEINLPSEPKRKDKKPLSKNKGIRYEINLPSEPKRAYPDGYPTDKQ